MKILRIRMLVNTGPDNINPSQVYMKHVSFFNRNQQKDLERDQHPAFHPDNKSPPGNMIR